LTLDQFVGREPERLNAAERRALAGQWIALEIYTTQTLPLRRIAAVGVSAEECMKQVASRGAKPADFEYTLVADPF
jgi:hypothetical protein